MSAAVLMTHSTPSLPVGISASSGYSGTLCKDDIVHKYELDCACQDQSKILIQIRVLHAVMSAPIILDVTWLYLLISRIAERLANKKLMKPVF